MFLNKSPNQTARLALALVAAVTIYCLAHAYGRLLRSRPKEPIALSQALSRGLGSVSPKPMSTVWQRCRGVWYDVIGSEIEYPV